MRNRQLRRVDKAIIPNTEYGIRHRSEMSMPPNLLEKQLARFLKERRGDQTFSTFARKVGLPASTLHRLENGRQSASLKIIHQLTVRLKASFSDIFR